MLGFKIGGAPVSATTTTASTSLLGGLLTGSKPATSAGALGGSGFSFGVPPSTQPPPASTTTTAATGFSLGESISEFCFSIYVSLLSFGVIHHVLLVSSKYRR